MSVVEKKGGGKYLANQPRLGCRGESHHQFLCSKIRKEEDKLKLLILFEPSFKAKEKDREKKREREQMQKKRKVSHKISSTK